MLTDSLLDDIGNVLERRSELLELVVAKGDVVSDIALVASDVESLRELSLSIFKLLLLVEDTAFSDEGFS